MNVAKAGVTQRPKRLDLGVYVKYSVGDLS